MTSALRCYTNFGAIGIPPDRFEPMLPALVRDAELAARAHLAQIPGSYEVGPPEWRVDVLGTGYALVRVSQVQDARAVERALLAMVERGDHVDEVQGCCVGCYRSDDSADGYRTSTRRPYAENAAEVHVPDCPFGLLNPDELDEAQRRRRIRYAEDHNVCRIGTTITASEIEAKWRGK